MQDTEVRDALRSYAGADEPALGLTSDGVLAAARRSRRARRLAGVSGFGLAAALIGVGFVVAPRLAGESPTFGAASACPLPPGSPPPGVVAADQPLPDELADWAGASLTCYLADAAPRLLPDARYAQVPGVPVGPLVGYRRGAEPPWGNRVDATALVRDAEGTGDLSVTVGVAGPTEASDEVAGCRSVTSWSCTVIQPPDPDGTIVTLNTRGPSDDGDRSQDYTARVYRGRTVVTVQVSNATGPGEPTVTRSRPVLTEEQTVDLALARELFLFR